MAWRREIAAQVQFSVKIDIFLGDISSKQFSNNICKSAKYSIEKNGGTLKLILHIFEITNKPHPFFKGPSSTLPRGGY